MRPSTLFCIARPGIQRTEEGLSQKRRLYTHFRLVKHYCVTVQVDYYTQVEKGHEYNQFLRCFRWPWKRVHQQRNFGNTFWECKILSSAHEKNLPSAWKSFLFYHCFFFNELRMHKVDAFLLTSLSTAVALLSPAVFQILFAPLRILQKVAGFYCRAIKSKNLY